MIRPLNPTYLPALLAPRSKLSPNEVHTRSDLGTLKLTASSSMSNFLKQWLSPSLRHTQRCWVWTEATGIQGLICIKKHRWSCTWTINHLLLSENAREDTCYNFLCMLGNYGREQEINKILLRLPSDSPLIEIAQQAGFSTYLREQLYQTNDNIKINRNAEKSRHYTIRPWETNDEYTIFRIYNQIFPAHIRAIEGMTFREWREVRGTLACYQWKRQFCCEREGSLTALFGIASEQEVGQFEMMMLPGEACAEILSHILTCFQSYHHMRCLVPECDGTQARTLKRYGFEPTMSYSVLTRSFTLPVKDASLVTT
ncbi:MAG: hypothetical protein J7L90_00045 [Dehalococcoidia bacterium]|nr:hypothetical protein [Dehalococcoidia bacterium]